MHTYIRIQTCMYICMHIFVYIYIHMFNINTSHYTTPLGDVWRALWEVRSCAAPWCLRGVLVNSELEVLGLCRAGFVWLMMSLPSVCLCVPVTVHKLSVHLQYRSICVCLCARACARGYVSASLGLYVSRIKKEHSLLFRYGLATENSNSLLALVTM